MVLLAGWVRFAWCKCCVCVIGRTALAWFRLFRCDLVFLGEWVGCGAGAVFAVVLLLGGRRVVDAPSHCVGGAFLAELV